MENALREAFSEAMLRHFGGLNAGAGLHDEPLTESSDLLDTVPNDPERAALQLSDTRRRIHNLVELACEGTAPASVLDKIRELEQLAGQQERRLCELQATVQPLDVCEQEELVARIRHLRALFRTSPKDAREALKRLLDDGIELFPLEEGRYRASWAVRTGALQRAETISTVL